MKIEEIMQLKEAGYTAEEIVALNNVIEKETAPVDQTPPEQPDYSSMFDSMKKDIMLEMKNLFISQQHGETVNAESVDDILMNHFKGDK